MTYEEKRRLVEFVENYDEIHTLVPESKKTLDSFPNSLYQDSPAWMLLFDTIRWMPLYD